MPRLLFFGIASLALVLAGVVDLRAEPAATTYPLHGVLRVFDARRGLATVMHDAVPGYMPAMTMDFAVSEPREMLNLAPGDTLTARLVVTADSASLADVQKVSGLPAATGSATPSEASVPDRSDVGPASELNVGDHLPDIPLVDQHGASVHLHDFTGAPVAIAFVYLGCPLPTYCPRLNRNFAVAGALLERMGAAGKARFLSISMDPSNDTPPRLSEYAQAHGADGARWTFATAEEGALRRLGAAVGLEFQRSGGIINHNLRTVVVDGQRRIRRVFQGNQWTPQELAAELRAAVRPTAE